MPFTAYHFGPAGFIGLVFKRWVDLPVFLLANAAIDIEVLIIYLLGLSWPHHRFCHTFIGGAVVGAALAAVCFPVRGVFKKVMSVFRLKYETTFAKMLVWSILGVWFHIFIDAMDHWDVRPFWPYGKNPLWRIIADRQIRIICLAFWAAALVLLAVHYFRHNPPAADRCKTQDVGQNSEAGSQ
jgi:membrane-bound metal-dependent hydrolase YbcI (DUF457 family)